MKTNCPFTRCDIESYLTTEYHITNLDTLFILKKINPEFFHDIVDDVFKVFISHWIDLQSGELVTVDPRNPIFKFHITGFNGYHSIEDTNDLMYHLENFLLLRDIELRKAELSAEKENPSKKQNDLEL